MKKKNKNYQNYYLKILKKNIVPIRKNRHYERNNLHKNKHPINKRKSI